jgi:hypothetical protein
MADTRFGPSAGVTVSAHAAARWVERVEPHASVEHARATILASASVIAKAAAFGCETVLLGCGARLLLDGGNVVTVLAPGQGFNRSIQRRGQV